MLRKSPIWTEGFLAGDPAADSQCPEVGPASYGPEGKARSWLNRLKHGRCARRPPGKRRAGGCRSVVGLYAGIRSEVVTTFEADQLADVTRAERVPSLAWTMVWKSGILGPEPQSSLFSDRCRYPSFSPARNRFWIAGWSLTVVSGLFFRKLLLKLRLDIADCA